MAEDTDKNRFIKLLIKKAVPRSHYGTCFKLIPKSTSALE